MTARRIGLQAAFLIVALACPHVVDAQTGLRGYELSAGVVIVGPMAIGSGDATHTRPGGGRLLIFNSDVSLGAGPGVEVHFGRSAGSRVAFEASGTWSFTTIRTDVSADIEGAPDATVTDDLARFSIEGSGLWRLAGGSKRALYLRGGAGWMRELAAGSTLAESGVIGNIGATVKYWWGASSSVPRRRLGLRLDGRAVIRSGGVDLGASGVQVMPAASADLMIGF